AWDEFALDGFCEGPALAAVQDALVDFAQEISIKPSYYVDLAALRCSQREYENGLGQKTRKHLRQNLRHYRERGPLRLEVARNSAEALAMMNRLADLNQGKWARRGLTRALACAS